MSAKQLEDFIKVIETAESLAKTETSSTWSYPTDIYASLRRRGQSPSASSTARSPRKVAPEPMTPVPKLWDPSSGSDFLGSSWGSSSKGGGAMSSSARSVTTVRSAKSSVDHESARSSQKSSTVMSSTTTATTTRSQAVATASTADKDKPKATAATVHEADVSGFDTLMNMQRHNRFARKKAKELMSSMSPTNSPRTPRKVVTGAGTARSTTTSRQPPTPKSAKSTPKSSPTKKFSTGSEASTARSTSGAPRQKSSSSRSSSSSPKSRMASIKSGSKSSVDSVRSGRSIESVRYRADGSDTSPSKSVTSPLKTSSRPKSAHPKSSSKSPSPPSKTPSATSQSSRSLSRSKTIRRRSPSPEEEPRRKPPAPVPRSRVTIRQDSVQLHVHQDDLTKQSPKAKRRRRPKSAPLKKKVIEEPKVDLRSYSKSLKLLGLDIPSNRTEATIVETQDIQVRTKSPTLRTRLKGRTQSVTDLREIVDSHHSLPKSDYSKIKNNLAKAVFEEWYFNKLRDMTAKKRAEEEKLEDELYEKEKEMEEKKVKAKENFDQWLEDKTREQKKKMKKSAFKSTVEEENDDAREAKLAKIRKAEDDWKAKKAAEFKKHQRLQRRLAKKKEQELEKQRQKHEDAEKHFVKWKETLNEKLKAKVTEEKKARLEELKAKQAEAKDKREAAEAAFKAWKAKKLEDHKKALGKAVKVEKDVNDNSEQRLEAAREAYDNWLEFVEQREEEDRFAEEEKMLREMWRPPWYPAGIADF